MKERRLVLALTAFVLCALLVSGSAGCKRSLSDEEAYKRFVGTWVNTDYPGTLDQSQVTVIRPDYVGEDWLFPDSESPAGQWTIKVKKTWVDEKGNTYCQSYNTRTQPDYMRYSVAFLMRVDKAGKVWECCVNPSGFEDTAVYSEEIDPNDQYYYIYYRK